MKIIKASNDGSIIVVLSEALYERKNCNKEVL